MVETSDKLPSGNDDQLANGKNTMETIGKSSN